MIDCACLVTTLKGDEMNLSTKCYLLQLLEHDREYMTGRKNDIQDEIHVIHDKQANSDRDYSQQLTTCYSSLRYWNDCIARSNEITNELKGIRCNY